MDYYYADGDVQKGPVQLAELARAGLRPDSLVWRDGMVAWQRADAMPELAYLFQGTPAYDSPAYAAPVAAYPAAAPVRAQAPQPAAPYGSPYASPSPYAAPGASQLAYGGYVPPGPQPSNGMAVASMVCGILSIPMMCAYGVGLPLAIVALALGHIVRGKIRRGEAAGDGMALAGLICGYVSLVLGVIGIAFVVIIAVVAASQ